MEWWRLLLADGCPDAGKQLFFFFFFFLLSSLPGKPLPHCLGDWTGEHNMAEAGELAHASMVRVSPIFYFFFFWVRKLTCPSMPIIPAIRKTAKANYWRVSGPQHIL